MNTPSNGHRTSAWRGAWTVYVKEVIENFRDRRSILSAVLYGPLIGPLMFAGMITLALKAEEERAEATLVLPVVGAEHAPNLIRFLRQQDVEIGPAPADPDQAVRNQNEEVVLIIPAAYADSFRAGRPATVQLVVDESRRQSRTTIARVERLLNGYSRQIGLLRLQARGVNPRVTEALAVESLDLSTAESRATLILGVLPYFVMLSLFVGGMYLAIDTTAGERERGSMEPLLINPVPRAAIMGGKLAATISFSLLSLALTLLAFSLSLELVPAENLGVALALGLGKMATLFLLVAPVALLAGALQTIIASFSKGFREAQTYLSILMLIPLLPVIILWILPVKTQTWMMAFPILSQTALIDKVMRGEAIPALEVGLSVASTLVLGLAFAVIAARLYNREQMLYAS